MYIGRDDDDDKEIETVKNCCTCNICGILHIRKHDYRYIASLELWHKHNIGSIIHIPNGHAEWNPSI